MSVKYQNLIYYATAIGLLLLAFPIFAQTRSAIELSSENREYTIIIFCFVLIVAWVIQIYMVFEKLKELELSDQPTKASFVRKLPFWHTPHRWTFLFIVILFPVGLSLVPRIFTGNELYHLPNLSFQFASSVFIIMITLEVAAIYNLSDTDNVWGPMLITALAIDVLAFLTFLLLGAPGKDDVIINSGFIVAFFIAAGLTSLASSFSTMYYAKTYDQHLRKELQEVLSPEFMDRFTKSKNDVGNEKELESD